MNSGNRIDMRKGRSLFGPDSGDQIAIPSLLPFSCSSSTQHCDRESSSHSIDFYHDRHQSRHDDDFSISRCVILGRLSTVLDAASRIMMIRLFNSKSLSQNQIVSLLFFDFLPDYQKSEADNHVFASLKSSSRRIGRGKTSSRDWQEITRFDEEADDWIQMRWRLDPSIPPPVLIFVLVAVLRVFFLGSNPDWNFDFRSSDWKSGTFSREASEKTSDDDNGFRTDLVSDLVGRSCLSGGSKWRRIQNMQNSERKNVLNKFLMLFHFRVFISISRTSSFFISHLSNRQALKNDDFDPHTSLPAEMVISKAVLQYRKEPFRGFISSSSGGKMILESLSSYLKPIISIWTGGDYFDPQSVKSTSINHWRKENKREETLIFLIHRLQCRWQSKLFFPDLATFSRLGRMDCQLVPKLKRTCPAAGSCKHHPD